MKANEQLTDTARQAKPQALPIDALEQIAGSRELSELADLASEYASEIRRSPFCRPSGALAGDHVPLVSLAGLLPSLSPFADDGGWYPSVLLTNEKLRQPPDLSLRISQGLLAGAVDSMGRPRIEQQHRTALAKGFVAARDAHPAYKRLRTVDGFTSLLIAFENARDRSMPASPLREPVAEAQLIVCIARSLPRLMAKGWRSAPTRKTVREAKKAVTFLIAAAKDGLHSLPSYSLISLHRLLRDLDAPASRARAPRLDEFTARTETLSRFEHWLEIYFGAASCATDLKAVRLCYAAMLRFQNPADKVSP